MKITEFYSPKIYYTSCLTTDIPVFGTEYEIEDILDYTPDKDKFYRVEEDHSLRNNGKEFITTPLSYEHSLQVFKMLHDNLKLGPNPYTPRTSTHVHLNILSLDVEQIKHLVLLYALLEPVFFAYAGEKRKQNIHCVPLNYTLLPKYYHHDIGYLVDHWSKYTAFNLLPIKTQGTVEFRHLGGTGSLEYYTKWLTLIRDLYIFIQNTPPDWLQKQLETGVTQREIQLLVLPTSFPIKPLVDDDKASIIDVKLAFV